MQKCSGKWRASVFCGNNCNLENKLFFLGNNKNAKLMKVSFVKDTISSLIKFDLRGLSFIIKFKI